MHFDGSLCDQVLHFLLNTINLVLHCHFKKPDLRTMFSTLFEGSASAPFLNKFLFSVITRRIILSSPIVTCPTLLKYWENQCLPFFTVALILWLKLLIMETWWIQTNNSILQTVLWFYWHFLNVTWLYIQFTALKLKIQETCP